MCPVSMGKTLMKDIKNSYINFMDRGLGMSRCPSFQLDLCLQCNPIRGKKANYFFVY